MKSGEINLKRIYEVEAKITQVGLENSSTKHIPVDSVLIALAGQGKTRGKVAINKIGLCTNQSIAAIIPSSKNLYYEYLYYNLDARYNELRRLSSGEGGRGGLNLGLLKGIKMMLPPLPEQRRIAEILSTWDEAITLTERLMAAKQRRKKALMQQLLTGKRRFGDMEQSHIEYRQTSIGLIPKDWKVKQLGEIGTFRKGKNIPKSLLTSQGVPCVLYGEIYTKYHFKAKKLESFIPPSASQQSIEIKKGDILFAGSGETLEEIGKCFTYLGDEKSYAGGDLIILTPNKDDSTFLGYLLNSSQIRRQKFGLGQGSSIVHIYSSGLKSIMIPLPPLPEQRRIAAVLQACDEEIDLLAQKMAALQRQKKALMQQLLTGKVRVLQKPSGLTKP